MSPAGRGSPRRTAPARPRPPRRSRPALTAGGRFNLAHITLEDQFGTALNSDNSYSRFNPVVGATYKITGNLTAYGGYSEANRASTPLELGCSDPVRPCLIDSFLISDPPLKQVVSHSFEAGLRGRYDLEGKAGELRWNAGAFTTENTDDIINVASTKVLGQGYFLNAGDTRRRGIEAGISYRLSPWNLYANYTSAWRLAPESDDPVSEHEQRAAIGRHGMVPKVAGDHLFEPFPLFGNRPVHPPAQFLL